MIKRLKISVAVLVFSAILSFVEGKSDVNVNEYRAGLSYANDEFGACPPIDEKSVARGWRYVLRYGHNEPESELSFSLMLVRSRESGQYILALHENPKLSFSELDEAGQEEKLRLADATRTIDASLAQTLYETWTKALLRAHLGSGIGRSTSANVYYISIFSIDGGYMSASADGWAKSKTTGNVREIGLLLRRLVKEKSQVESAHIEDLVRATCGKIR